MQQPKNENASKTTIFEAPKLKPLERIYKMNIAKKAELCNEAIVFYSNGWWLDDSEHGIIFSTPVSLGFFETKAEASIVCRKAMKEDYNNMAFTVRKINLAELNNMGVAA